VRQVRTNLYTIGPIQARGKREAFGGDRVTRLTSAKPVAASRTLAQKGIISGSADL
jgi:hypothetical protein